MYQLVHLLYKQLRSAPALFHYALVGIEVDEFRTYEELIADDFILQNSQKFSELVVSQDIWGKLGNPNNCIICPNK